MKRVILSSTAIVTAAILAGCGGSDGSDGYGQDPVNLLDELTDTSSIQPYGQADIAARQSPTAQMSGYGLVETEFFAAVGQANVTADFDANTLDGTIDGFNFVEGSAGCNDVTDLSNCQLTYLGKANGSLDVQGNINPMTNATPFDFTAVGTISGTVYGESGSVDIDVAGSGGFGKDASGTLVAIGEGDGTGTYDDGYVDYTTVVIGVKEQ